MTFWTNHGSLLTPLITTKIISPFNHYFLQDYPRISSSGITPTDHFTFSSIASPQQANVPFAVTLTYRNPSNQVIDYNGQATLASNLGRASPNTVTLTNGVWQGNVSLDEPGTGVYLNASAQGAAGTSNAFTINGAGSTLGNLNVTVQNNREQPIAAANVYLDKNNDGVKDFSGVTDGTGHITFYSLPAGQYTLWAAKTKESQRNPVTVVAGRTITATVQINTFAGKTPVIFIPGIMGSTVKWSHSPYPLLPEEYPAWNDSLILHNPFNAAGWKTLKEQFNGKCADYPIIEAPYDWRMPANNAVEQYLKPAIERAKQQTGSPKVRGCRKSLIS